jgi:hypothetical protein
MGLTDRPRDGSSRARPQPGAPDADEPDARLPRIDATFSAAQVKGFACSQAEQPQLSAEDWKTYFGDEPLRFTCGEPAKYGAGF